jgi:hypothetical protein
LAAGVYLYEAPYTLDRVRRKWTLIRRKTHNSFFVPCLFLLSRGKRIPDKPVWSGDGVQVGLLPVVHEGVGLPDLAQHLYGQGEGILAGILTKELWFFSKT